MVNNNQIIWHKIAFGVLFTVLISCAAGSSLTPSGNGPGTGGAGSGGTGNPTPTAGGGGGGYVASTADFTVSAYDYVLGTAGDDVFSGIVPTTIQSTDRVEGADGTDVIVVTGALVPADLASLPTTVSNVEIVNFSSPLGSGTWDLSTKYSSSNGITLYDFSDITALSGGTITTGNVGTLKLATGAGGTATAGGVTWAMDNTVASPTLQLIGYQGNATAPANLTIAATGATSLTINSGNTPSKIGTLDAPAGVLAYTLSGDAPLTFALAAGDVAAPNSINASTSAGVRVDLSAGTPKAAFTFTGGTAADVLTLGNSALTALTSGSQLNAGASSADKLVLNTSSGEEAKINAVQGFEILGLNANITLDASAITGSNINHFTVESAGRTQTITGLQNGSIVDVGAGATAPFTANSLSLAGANVTLNLGGSGDTVAHNITGLTIGGTTGVTIVSNGSAINSISSVTNTPSNFTVNGAATLALTTFSSAVVLNAAGMTGALTTAGSTSADTITGGSAADTLLGRAGIDTINGGNGADTIIGGATGELNQADVLTGGGDADTFKFIVTNTGSVPTDVGRILGESSGTTAIVQITDFVAGTDKIGLEITGVPVSGTSVSLDVPQVIGTCADLTAVYGGITVIPVSVPGGALSAVVVTCSTGGAAGTYLYINNATSAVETVDMLINMTGLSGTLTSADFSLL
ncbi:MAG: hypothetical protein V4534_05845 [Myxococcota bacterium]